MRRLDHDKRQELMVKPELKEGQQQKKEKTKEQKVSQGDSQEKKAGKGRKQTSSGEDFGLIEKNGLVQKKEWVFRC